MTGEQVADRYAELPVVVIGAGPVGLAAAAQLYERGLPFVVLEAGDEPGAAVSEWGHVRLFSPWRYNTDPAARRVLEASGWELPDPDRLPTGADLVALYLKPLAESAALAPSIRYGTRVVALSRDGVDRVRTADRESTPFVVRTNDGAELLARAVIDASGTWRTPNVLGVNGLAAHGEVDASGSVEPAMPGTEVTWAVRGGDPERAYGGGDDDALPGRGALGSSLRTLVESGRVGSRTGFGVRAVRPTGDGRVEVTARSRDGVEQRIVVDRIVSATGFRPDHALADELRLDLDPALGCTRALAPLIDPNVHSCGTVRPHGVDELSHPDPGYFIVGMKSYGRAPTFLLATGYEQTRSIAAALAGDWTAARDVQLDLPETGVCSVSAGARAIATDAAARLGLDPDVPAKLVSATIDNYFAVGEDLDAAVHAAADQLGIDPSAAEQLAVLVSDQLHSMLNGDSEAGSGRKELAIVGGGEVTSGGCCG